MVAAARPGLATAAPGGTPRALGRPDIERFAALSHDPSPIHLDAAFARRTHLGAPVVHGMLLWALAAAALRPHLRARWPHGWLPLAQTLAFRTPVYVGDAVSAQVDPPAPDGAGLSFGVRLRDPNDAVAVDGRIAVCDAATGYAGGVLDDSINRTDLESDPTLYGLALGQTASAAGGFTESDLDAYVDLTGDDNPPVASGAVATALGLPGRLVPAPLLGAMVSALLGTRLPGPGTDWLSQRLACHGAACAGEPLTASVTVTRLARATGRADLGCVITAADGRLVATGEARVQVRTTV
jgi:acyl dehydratase